MLDYSRDKNEGTCRRGEGEEGPKCDPGSELLPRRSARVVRGYNWDEENKYSGVNK